MRLAVLIALIAAAALAAWVALRPPTVTVASVRAGSAAEIVYASGVVEPVRWAALAPLTRARIVETCACEAAEVAEGEPILRLDDVAARAHLAELEAKLALAQKSLGRAESLLERQVASLDRYDIAQALVAELTAGVAVARSAIDDLALRAPLDGIVLRLDAEVGEVAEPGQPLAWIGQPKPLRIESEVNEEEIPRVVPGQRALIKADAFPGRPLEAEVAAITPKGDPDLRTYRVRLALPDDTPLMIGMSVEVNIVTRSVAETLIAPAAALVGGAVFAVEDGRLKRLPVIVGISGPETVELTSGAAAGMTVVSPASDALRDGQRVRVIP